MVENWQDILSGLEADVAPGATPEALKELEESMGGPLPDEVRQLLAYSDGAEIPAPWLQFLSVSDVSQYVPTMKAIDKAGEFGLTSFAEAGDSNPFCLFARGPLAGYVVRVHHDRNPQVAFRTLHSFVEALQALASESDDVEDLQYEFDDDRTTRTPDDTRRGLELIRAAEKHRGDDARLYLISMALQLLTAQQIDAIARLLDDEWFVRRAAQDTLRQLNTPESRRVLQEDEQEMRSFTQRVVAAMGEAGLTAAEAEVPGHFKVEPGPFQMHLEGHFIGRNDPATIAELVERVKRRVQERI